MVKAVQLLSCARADPPSLRECRVQEAKKYEETLVRSCFHHPVTSSNHYSTAEGGLMVPPNPLYAVLLSLRSVVLLQLILSKADSINNECQRSLYNPYQHLAYTQSCSVHSLLGRQPSYYGACHFRSILIRMPSGVRLLSRA